MLDSYVYIYSEDCVYCPTWLEMQPADIHTVSAPSGGCHMTFNFVPVTHGGCTRRTYLRQRLAFTCHLLRQFPTLASWMWQSQPLAICSVWRICFRHVLCWTYICIYGHHCTMLHNLLDPECMCVCNFTLDGLLIPFLFTGGDDSKNVSHVKNWPRPKLTAACPVYVNLCYVAHAWIVYV